MRHDVGLSLVELIIVITIIAILSWGSFHYGKATLNHHRQEQSINTLEHALQLAKLAALSHHQKIMVCPAPWQGACGQDWTQGIAIVLMNTTPTLLQQLPAFNIPAKIVWQGWLKHPYVLFEADGTPHSYHGSFWWCEKDSNAPLLVINHMGRIRSVDINNVSEEHLLNPCGD